MKTLPCLTAFLITLPVAVPADNTVYFDDYAQVISSEPVVERKNRPVSSNRSCTTSGQTTTGTTPVGPSIAQDIASRERRWATRIRCNTKPGHPVEPAITGYWVTYRYAGRNESRYFPADPGDWIPVQVNLTPTP